MTPITGDQENSAPQPNFRFRREDEISPDPGGEQDRRPQCDPSVILARRYAGFTSPARRQAQTQRRCKMRCIPPNLGSYRCHESPMTTLTASPIASPIARVYRKWTICVKPRAHCH
jgi:hypothetical protein